MAALDSRQKQYTEALNNVRLAMGLDPGNLDFYVLQGDIYASSGNFQSAIDSYNTAIDKGKNDGSVWTAKVETIIKMNQSKYGTNDANTLTAKMNAGEKKNLCNAISTGLSQGMKSMNIEMTQVAICK